MRINDRKFGVELEVSTVYSTVEKTFKKFSKVIVDRGGTFRMSKTYYKSDGRTWDLKSDASTGAEICTPSIMLNNSRNIAILMLLLDELRKNCYVTINDGLHVHVNIADVEPMEKLNLIWNWVKFERLFLALFPSNRKNSRFAVQYLPKIKNYLDKNEELHFERVCGKLTLLCDQHYSVVNLTSIPSMEFRLMEGSLSDIDILNWIELCVRFVDKTKGFYRKNKKDSLHISQLKNPDVDELIDLCGIKHNSNLDKWIKYRKLKVSLDESVKQLKPLGASY